METHQTEVQGYVRQLNQVHQWIREYVHSFMITQLQAWLRILPSVDWADTRKPITTGALQISL